MPHPTSDPVSRALIHFRESLPGATPTRTVIAYSGGLDSTVLLHAAHRVLHEGGHPLKAIHVHHGLSPNADAWAAHCLDACGPLNIPCEVVRIHVPAHDPAGPEAAARRERYRILGALPADSVLLAHHADDQAETVLHNLLRGTGLLGLAGMPTRSDRYARPLLKLSRLELQTYAAHNDLRWIEDESNRDQRFTRNHVRARLIPVLEQRFPTVAQNLARMAGHASEAQHLLEELARIDDPGGELAAFPIRIEPLRQLSTARLINLLRCKLKACGHQSPAAERLREFARQLQSAAPDRHPALDTGAWLLQVSGRKLHLNRSGQSAHAHAPP